MLTIPERVRKVELNLFAIDEWTARSTVTKADKKDVVQGDGIAHTVAVKTHDDGRILTAVTSTIPGQQDSIEGIFPVPEAVGIRDTAMDTLVAMCDRYGAEITVGGVTTTLVIDREEPGPPPEIMERISREIFQQGRPGHEFAGASSVRGVRETRTTQFSFFFTLDLTAILNDLA